MKTCPECGREVRPVWPTCKSCGTLLMARPEPLVPVGAAAEAPVAAVLSEAEQFFAPVALHAGSQPPPAASSFPSPTSRYASADDTPAEPSRAAARRNPVVIGAVVFLVLAAVATAYFTLGSGAKNHETPVVLPPRAPTAGLPTSLDAIVRIEAESARHTALQAVEQTGSSDIGRLTATQPNYTWIGGDQASTDPKTVSIAQNGPTVTIAVSASSKDVCAYGRWTSGETPVYVTMAHEPSCAATTAPNIGWSTEPGGAASDLPDDNVG